MSAGSITQAIQARPEQAMNTLGERFLQFTSAIKKSLAKTEIEAAQGAEQKITDYAYRQIVERVITSRVGYRLRQMLLANYNRANLGNYTPEERKRYNQKSGKKRGWLREMLAKVSVYPVYKVSGGLRLAGIGYKMPKEGFHEAAAALAYGSVHTGKHWAPSFDKDTGAYKGETYRSLLGKPAKQSLKKFAQFGFISKRSRTRIQNDYSERMKGIVRKGVTVFEKPKQFGVRTKSVGYTSFIHGGKTIWVSKAFSYWELSADQIAELNRVFIQGMMLETKYRR